MNNTNDFSDLKNFINDSYNSNKLKRKKQKRYLIILINIISIILLIGGGFGLKSIIDYKKDATATKDTQKELLGLVNTIKKEEVKEKDKQEDKLSEKIDPTITELFTSLLEKNDNTIGWLKVKGTDIDMPIVQSNDNTYYLTHNFDNKWNSMGWAFADYHNTFPNLNTNTIIYGHTYKKTIIFSSLTNVLAKEWLDNKENYIIKFITTEKVLYFKIFSIYTTKATTDYLKTSFTYNEYINFIDEAKNKSIYNFNEDIKFNTKILTLSTCYNNSDYRLVIEAKLLDKELEEINYEE